MLYNSPEFRVCNYCKRVGTRGTTPIDNGRYNLGPPDFEVTTMVFEREVAVLITWLGLATLG
jgi:hypothetical protein